MIPQRKGPGSPTPPAVTDAAVLRAEIERLKMLMRVIVPAAASYERRVDRIGQYPELMPYLTPDDLAANIEKPYEVPAQRIDCGAPECRACAHVREHGPAGGGDNHE